MLTKEQLELRKKFVGGSDIAIVMGHSPYKTAHQLWLEKTGQVEAEDISLLKHVQRGVIYESIARERAEEKYATSFPPILMMHKEHSFIGANLDGLSEDNVVLEIKCMGLENHINTSLGQIPYHYNLQLQYQMMIVGADKGIFCSYRPEDDEANYVEVTADKKLWDEMTKAAIVFWHHVETKTPLVELTNELKSLISAWKAAKVEADTAITRAEVLKEEIESKLEDDTEYDGVKITHYEQKGNIDYSKIEVLKTMDLEQYRKASSKRVRFSL